MGSSASKASRTAGAAARRYPSRSPQPPPPPPPPPSQSQPSGTTRPSPPPPPHTQAGPTVHPQPQASNSRSEAINLDASDPDFAQSLRTLGPVQPNPTLSGSSSFSQNPNNSPTNLYTRPSAPDPSKNPAITVLASRSRLQDEADAEFQQAGRRGHAGRQFLDVYMIRQILVLRDEKGKSPVEIEKSMGLKAGVVARLGAKGMLGLAQEQGRANKGIEIV